MSVYGKEMSRFMSSHRGRDEGATGGAPGERRGSIVKVLLLTCLLAAGSAAAQEPNQVFMDATYLGAPTDWCPASAGVPVIVKMDGPEIIAGPQDLPKSVRERAGNKIRRVVNGKHTASFWSNIEIDQNVVGRFAAEFKTCYGLWGTHRVTGSWRLIGLDGSDLDSGAFEDVPVYSFYLPFFSSVSGPSSARYAKFGDRLLFTANRPETTTTQTFAAEPGKE